MLILYSNILIWNNCCGIIVDVLMTTNCFYFIAGKRWWKKAWCIHLGTTRRITTNTSTTSTTNSKCVTTDRWWYHMTTVVTWLCPPKCWTRDWQTTSGLTCLSWKTNHCLLHIFVLPLIILITGFLTPFPPSENDCGAIWRCCMSLPPLCRQFATCRKVVDFRRVIRHSILGIYW